MHRDLNPEQWIAICALDQIVPNTGVCALVGGQQVAVFRVAAAQERVFAIGNLDPNSGAAVLSRGMVGNLGERVVVASPMYKQHFDLMTGECLEAPAQSVASYRTRIEDGKVWVSA